MQFEQTIHSSCSKVHIFSKKTDLPCDHIFFNRLAQQCHDLYNRCGMLIMSVINVIHVVHQQFFKNKVDSTVQRKNVQNDSLLFTSLLVFVSMAWLYWSTTSLPDTSCLKPTVWGNGSKCPRTFHQTCTQIVKVFSLNGSQGLPCCLWK